MTSIEQAREALTRQTDNMAFILNHVTLPENLYEKFTQELAADREALSPSTPVDGVGAGPRVKPLEWYEGPIGHERDYAESIFGQWAAWEVSGRAYYRAPGMAAGTGVGDGTLDAAKAAAQADYERRVLSALASPETEARLRERVRKLESRVYRLDERLQAEQWSHGQTGAACDKWREIAETLQERLRDRDTPPTLPDGCCGYTNADGACCSPPLPSEIDAATDVACGVDNTYGGEVLCGEDRAIVELGLRRLVGAGWTVAAEIGLLKRVPETRNEAEARIMQEYRWGNLTSLGVANHLRRAGFRQEIAINKANALASPETEARLRERALRENLRQINDEVRFVQDPVCRNNLAYWVQNTCELFGLETFPAEARLAQAEGGPAVTDMHRRAQKAEGALAKAREVAAFHMKVLRKIADDGKCWPIGGYAAYEAMERWLVSTGEAALHPQSSAGEEGK